MQKIVPAAISAISANDGQRSPLERNGIIDAPARPAGQLRKPSRLRSMRRRNSSMMRR